MVTTVAFYILAYCVGVLGGALLLRLFGRRRPAARSLSARLLATFGIFAIAAAYVWVDLGPEIDHRIALQHEPLRLPQPPRTIDI